MSEKTVRNDTPYGPQLIDVFVCDGCDAETTEDAAIGWIAIDHLGVSIEQLGDRPTPLHACSAFCAPAVLMRLSWVRAYPIDGDR